MKSRETRAASTQGPHAFSEDFRELLLAARAVVDAHRGSKTKEIERLARAERRFAGGRR